MDASSEALPVILIQMRMLAANHQTEHRDPIGGVREETEGAEGDCKPIERTTTSTNWTPQSSQGLNHQPKSTHEGALGSSSICSRGQDCLEEKPLVM